MIYFWLSVALALGGPLVGGILAVVVIVRTLRQAHPVTTLVLASMAGTLCTFGAVYFADTHAAFALFVAVTLIITSLLLLSAGLQVYEKSGRRNHWVIAGSVLVPATALLGALVGYWTGCLFPEFVANGWAVTNVESALLAVARTTGTFFGQLYGLAAGCLLAASLAVAGCFRRFSAAYARTLPNGGAAPRTG